MKDLDANDHPPEIPRQQTDVEERGAGQAEEHRRARVEDGEAEGEPC